jgi:hypothetical protein
VPTPCSTLMSNTISLGNLEESLRPFLGRIVSTGSVHGSTKVQRNPVGDYGTIHPLHCRFAGDRCASLVSGRVQSGSQRKARNHWFVGSRAQQRRKLSKAAQADDYSFSRSWVTAKTIQRCTIAKVRFFESPHCRTLRNARAARLLNRTSNLTLNHEP